MNIDPVTILWLSFIWAVGFGVFLRIFFEKNCTIIPVDTEIESIKTSLYNQREILQKQNIRIWRLEENIRKVADKDRLVDKDDIICYINDITCRFERMSFEDALCFSIYNELNSLKQKIMEL